jgi:outer membrane protein assembly factor BamE (lipoprotein component of BamABCDE complex)
MATDTLAHGNLRTTTHMTGIHPLARINMKALLIGGALLALAGLCGCGPGASEQRRNDYIAAHPETNGTTSSLIQNGRVAPGMTKDQVIAAWGSPPSGCKTFQTNYQTIWDYCHHPGRTLVIFDQSGRVSNVQMP